MEVLLLVVWESAARTSRQLVTSGRSRSSLRRSRSVIAPDTPLDAIVKGLGKAAGTYRTIRADPARASLLLAVGEQRVCHSATVRKKGPVISLVACHDSYSTLTWQAWTSIVCQEIKDDLYRCLAVQVSGIVSPVTYSGCHAVHAPQARLVEPFQGED